jgi:hypothetical protein
MAEDSKVISFADRQRAKAAQSGADAPGAPEAADATPVAAQLIWLHCPACKTTEYTEMAVPGGRTHNLCGSQVEEMQVEVDARAEYSLAEFNLRRLEAIAELVDAQRQRYLEYQERLHKAAGQKLESSPLTEETLRRLPVAEVDGLGLLVSRFFHKPEQHFAPPAPPEPPDGSTSG